MVLLLVALLGLAAAAEHELGVAVGGHGSLGLKTRIVVTGAEGGPVYRLQGEERSALQVEAQDLWGTTASGPVHLLGLKVGWSRQWGDGDLRGYSLVSLGGYLNDILPVLPVLWVEGGVELGADRIRWRVGPEVYSLPPFFVGGGLRVTATTVLGGSS